MAIPVGNIYYLLCYAWNKLEEKDRVNVSIDGTTQLYDLFAKVLINATRILLKRGIDKSYIDHTDEIAGIRGKLELTETLKSHLLSRQKTICSFDEFSADILINRILVSTIHNLCNIRVLDKQLKKDLKVLQRMLYGIKPIKLNARYFQQVKLYRNNRFYSFVMHICELVYESILPDEEPGQYQFKDFTRNERKMNRLFEAFVRNFYKIEQQQYSVQGERIEWKMASLGATNKKYLPQMCTDITLRDRHNKVIMDTKYYKDTLSTYHNKESIKSENLYQLFSYLLNQHNDADKQTLSATGILLYPTIKTEYNLDYTYEQHNIKIRTVDLNANWQDIARRLKEIIGV